MPGNVKEIFLAAAELPVSDRAAYLDRECGHDQDLRRRVEALLRAHDDSDALPEPNVTGSYTPSDVPEPSSAEAPGTIIAGRYKLLEVIGEGGMGSVFVAEQSQPVRRKVALKLIKAGMDSKQVLARFEAERQALALMDHPNIAKVLDGGLTEQGRPFFVMEYIKGVPLTEYCDDVRLGVRDRLQLFVAICQAVQHAHQKGIIHRDLKPSNILIALYDGRPVPKVIDFGLAKAMHQSLTDGSVYTGHQMVLGTPLYMSPEQSELNNLDVDTRTDIYSLGVILYELLTGKTPIDKERFKKAAWHEMLRLIRDEEPPKPSTKLSGSAELPSVAANRQLEPSRLSKLMLGDLDWITMKALEKDRTRRYETANGFAMDIQRYLADEPVSAGPPGVSYRIRKFARKNRAVLATAVSLLLLLVSGVVISTWQAIRARHAESDALAAKTRAEDAEQLATERLAEMTREKLRADEQTKIAQAVNNFLQEDLLLQADSEQQAERGFIAEPNLTVKQALQRAAQKLGDRFHAQPLIELSIRGAIGHSLAHVGDIRQGIPHLERSYSLAIEKLGPTHEETLRARNNLGNAYLMMGRVVEAVRIFEELNELSRTVASNHPDISHWKHNLANGYDALQRYKDGFSLRGEVLRLIETRFGPDHVRTFNAKGALAGSYFNLGQRAEALRLQQQAAEQCENLHGPDHPTTLHLRRNLAWMQLERRQISEVISLLQENINRYTARMGPNHPHTLASRGALAKCYFEAGRLQEALRESQVVLPLIEEALGREHEVWLQQRLNLGLILQALDRVDEAVATHEDTLKRTITAYGLENEYANAARHNLGLAYITQGRAAHAIPLFEEIIRIETKNYGTDNARTLGTKSYYALALQNSGRLVEAITIFEETLKREEKVLGPDQIQTTKNRHNLAAAYMNAGRYTEASRLLEPTLARLLKEYGPNHHDALAAAGNLALANYYSVPRVPEAIRLAEETLDRHYKVFGPDHRTTIAFAANVGRMYSTTGEPEKAIALLEDSVNRATAKFNVSSVSVLQLRQYLGEAYLVSKRVDDAIRIHEESIRIGSEKYSTDHMLIAGLKSQLGRAYRKKGRTSEAVKLQEEAVKVYESKCGPDHRDTLLARSEYGSTLAEDQRFDKAVRVLEPTYATMKTKLGADHGETMNTIGDLAHALLYVGRGIESIKLFEEQLKYYERTQGRGSPRALSIQSNLVNAYRHVGRHHDSIPILKSIVKELIERYGEDHIETLIAMNNLGTTYSDLGQKSESINLFKKVHAALPRHYDKDHPKAMLVQFNLARDYSDLREFSIAIELFQDLLDRQLKKNGPDHVETLLTQIGLAQTYHSTGRFDEAIALLVNVRERQAKIDPDHMDSWATLQTLALVYRDAGRLPEAIQILEELHSKMVARLGAHHVETIKTLQGLGTVYWMVKDYQRAIPVFEVAVRAIKEKNGPDNPLTRQAIYNLGVNLAHGGRLAEGIALLEDNVAWAKKQPPEVRLREEEYLVSGLAGAYELNKTVAKAEPLFRESVELAKKLRGSDDPQTATRLAFLADNLAKQDKFAEAEPVWRECLQIRLKKEPNDWTTFNAKLQLGQVLLSQKKHGEAAQLLNEGHDGMKARKANVPTKSKERWAKSLEQLIRAYEEHGQPTEAAKWKAELEKLKTENK